MAIGRLLSQLMVLSFLTFICFAIPQTVYSQGYIGPEDLEIVSMPEVELNKPLSLDQAISKFGQPSSCIIEYGEAWTGWHAVFQDIELWVLGAKDKQTPGLVARVIISKQGFSTSRELAIGDSEIKAFSLYGEPGFTSRNNNGITWHRFFIQDSLQRLLIGVDKAGIIVKLGYSTTAGGL